MEYWEECVAQALEDAGLEATKEQLDCIIGWVEGAHDNYGMATGEEFIPNPVETQATNELREMKREQERHANWVNSTKPCRTCTTTGTARDDWGRDMVCPDCRGTGRTR